jgi:hypothetical protein
MKNYTFIGSSQDDYIHAYVVAHDREQAVKLNKAAFYGICSVFAGHLEDLDNKQWKPDTPDEFYRRVGGEIRERNSRLDNKAFMERSPERTIAETRDNIAVMAEWLDWYEAHVVVGTMVVRRVEPKPEMSSADKPISLGPDVQIMAEPPAIRTAAIMHRGGIAFGVQTYVDETRTTNRYDSIGHCLAAHFLEHPNVPLMIFGDNDMFVWFEFHTEGEQEVTVHIAGRPTVRSNDELVLFARSTIAYQQFTAFVNLTGNKIGQLAENWRPNKSVKFCNGVIVRTKHECLFLQGSQAFNVGDKVDIYYNGPDRTRFNKIGDITIKSITFDPPGIKIGHASPDAQEIDVLPDQKIHTVGTLG